MMRPKLDPRFLPLILLALMILHIPCCLCEDDYLYETCKKPFECGGMSFGYPFWSGDDRQAACGQRGFELRCNDGITRIDAESVSYRVLHVDNETRTLKVARDDLWAELCPKVVHNTTFDSNPFNFYREANDREIFLFYGCAWLPSELTAYQFKCNISGTDAWSFFQNPVFNWPTSGSGIVCSIYISARVNETAARLLKVSPTRDLFLDALKNGFRIQWNSIAACGDCKLSGGVCGQYPDSGKFACHCSHGTQTSNCIQTENVKPGSTSRKTIIAVTSGVAGMLVSALAIFYITKQWRLHKLNRAQFQHVQNILPVGNGSLAPKRYSYREIRKITRSFTDKLGQGGYGIVYKGWLPDDQIVAVKVLTETSTSDGEEFINEVASISRTSHINIVNLLGFSYNGKRRALVYEFMPNKSLDQFIYSPDCQLEWKKLHDIAIGVARGLEYLHKGCNSRIIHFDIKPQNILLDEDFCPKISDFGLAKIFKKKQSMVSLLGTRGTIGYIAPEVCFRCYGAVSHKSDVYSFGMVLLDMVGTRKIDQTEATISSENYFHDKIYAALNNGKLDDLSTTEEDGETAKKMFLVGLWCIQTVPSDRPSMTKVVEMLQGSIQSIPVPPKPSLCFPNLPKPQFSSTFSIDVEIDM